MVFTICLIASAQMTLDQKVQDFQQLAALYAKNYAPYEWKILSQGFDLYNLAPWLVRVRATKDDLEFVDLCMEYVASLNDAHDGVNFQSTFRADLNIRVDIYDGKVLIDNINRSRLSATAYPFQIGDELVSVDGKTPEEWISILSKYNASANASSTRRTAVSMIVYRNQMYYPYAHQIPDSATVVIRRQNDALETYDIPWLKRYTPVTFIGPVPSPRTGATRTRLESSEDTEPGYMAPLRQLRNVRLPDGRQTVLNLGSSSPIFRLPSNFQQRLGSSSSSTLYSGSYEAYPSKIGFIRIAQFPSDSYVLSQFEREIVWMQQNTDGLVIDVMRNPGGDACQVESMLQRVIPFKFRTMGFAIRATAYWIYDFAASLGNAKLAGAPQPVIDQYEMLLKEVETAYQESRGNTGPLPLCGTSLEIEPAKDSYGNVIAYTKPLMVLTDEFSASGGDVFPAIIQDNSRGTIFGMRTMGAGGSLSSVDSDATTYSELTASVTRSLMVRKEPVVTPDLPPAPFIENIGVRPDVEWDYMSKLNLLNSGRDYVDHFTYIMLELIQKSKP